MNKTAILPAVQQKLAAGNFARGFIGRAGYATATG
jgi:hypothetical protein